MGNQKWLYRIDDKQFGPVTTEEMKSLIEIGRVGPQTPITEEGSENWISLEDAHIFTHGDIDQKEPMVREKKDGFENQRLVERSLDVPHPWHRFWARILDYMIFAFFFSKFFIYILPLHFMSSHMVLMSIIFGWVFVEAMFLCTWKKTLGKWLFNISVEHQNGQRLTYRDALARSFSVWWLGVGAGIPVVSLITMIVGCVKLSNNRITTWDNKGAYKITHGKLSWWRISIITVLYVLLGYIFLTVNVWIVQYTMTILPKLWV